MKISGWGRYPKIYSKVSAPRTVSSLQVLVQQGNAIARGNARSYGDSSISTTNTIHMKHFNHMLQFDEQNGQLIAEAGVLLADIIEVFLPRGWFPSVTPGTKFVTLGGMIAADVHGKNHHKDGSFGNCVDWIELMTADGAILRCSKSKNIELFEWTIGGMGLTGIIVRAAIRLRPVSSAWVQKRTLIANNIETAIDLFEQSNDATYSVAWIDCNQIGAKLGRSLVMLGEHAEVNSLPLQHSETPLETKSKRKFSVPIELPNWTLNKLSVRTFNALYYLNGKLNSAPQLVDWDSYFYPLDAIRGWNKIYGRNGFVQFQCVIPLDKSLEGLIELLEAIANSKLGSFLAVLKRFGPQNTRFSFPMEGYTLALDFPVNADSLSLMKHLDQITLKHGGRFYLAKDSRMPREIFERSDQRIESFKRYRKETGLEKIFSSTQSKRLGL